MRVLLPLIPLVLAAALPPALAGISDPSLTSQVLRVTSTPQMAPGDRGNITGVLHNPYAQPMEAVVLRAEIYRYTSNRLSTPVNASMPTPLFAASGGIEDRREASEIPPGGNLTFDLGIVTTPSVLHGAILDQGSYSVRFRLDLTLDGTRAVMVSLGHFTADQWRAARTPRPGVDPSCLVGDLDYCYLGALLGLPRIDGLLPDTSFGVQEALPPWPFYLLGTASGLLALGALAAFVLEHPGRYPRLEAPLRRLLRRRPSKPL